jgi:hypothetical protein
MMASWKLALYVTMALMSLGYVFYDEPTPPDSIIIHKPPPERVILAEPLEP